MSIRMMWIPTKVEYFEFLLPDAQLVTNGDAMKRTR